MDLNLATQVDSIRGNLHGIETFTPIKPIEIGDFQLWKDFQEGSEIAYETIYRTNVVLLYRFGLKLIKNKELVEDCIQDLFLEIWQRKHRLSSIKSIKSYLLRSFRRKLISESVKKRKIFTEYLGTTVPDCLQNTSFETSLIHTQQLDRQKQKLKSAIGMLTSRQQEIVQLKFYALLNYVEIAEVLELSMKGTYKLMGRAISQLRQHMNEQSLPYTG